MLACRQPVSSINRNENFRRNFYLKKMQRNARADPLEGISLSLEEESYDGQSLWSMTPSIHTNWSRPILSSGRTTPVPPTRAMPPTLNCHAPPLTRPIPVRGSLMDTRNPYSLRNPPNQTAYVIESIPVRNRYRYWPQHQLDRRHSYPETATVNPDLGFSRELRDQHLVSINNTINRLEQTIESRQRLSTVIIIMLILTLYALVILNVIERN